MATAASKTMPDVREKTNLADSAMQSMATGEGRASNHSAILHDAVRLLQAGPRDLTRVERLLSLVVADLSAESATAYEFDRGAGLLRPVVTTATDNRARIMAESLPSDSGLPAEVIQYLKPCVSPAVNGERRTVAAPLLCSEEVAGVLLLEGVGKELQGEGEDLLALCAAHTACFLHEMRMQEDLSQSRVNLREQFMRAEKMRAMGEMASGVFHDFNNILGAIMGRIQLMQLKATDEEIKKALTQIERIALQGAETVKRLQAFARLRSDEAAQSTDLNLVVEDALEVTRHRWESQAQRRGVTYNVNRRLGKECHVNGLHSQLVDAVANLILNAVDAMEMGGQLTLETSRVGETCRLIVSDDGIGMTPEQVKNVFSPFYTTKGQKGTGLGLTVVHDIIVSHNGSVRVQSQPSQGATFIIDLPIFRDASTSVPEKPVSDEPQGLRLLVVDDDNIILDVVTEALEDAGHRVDCFSRGGEAIDAIGRSQYDVVVTDLGMPDVTGWEVARAAKLHQPRLPVVVISGWGAQFSDEQLTDSGVDAMLAKPFHLQVLRDTIEKLAKGEAVSAK
ncbi:MAG: ATP-binding protein [Candidatus Zixiibacteriota bacterium]